MKITRVTVHKVEMPRQGGEYWHFALGGGTSVEPLMVKVDTDQGIVGWGCTNAPQHYGETKEGAVALIEKHFTPFVLGKDPTDIEAINAGMDRIIQGNNWTKSTINVACWDILGKSAGVPIYRLTGGKVRDKVPVMRLVPILAPPEAAKRCERLAGEGYKHLKIKFDGDLETDIARIREIRKAVGDHIELVADANQSYDTAGAIAAARRLEQYNVSTMEQPVAWDNLEGLATITSRVSCFVEGDESARSPADIFKMIKNHTVNFISLKIMKLGGISGTLRAAHVCAAGFMPCRMGAAVGSRLLAAANMHVIASTPNLGAPAEVAEFAGLDGDPVEGIEVINGFMTVPEGPGLGVKVNL